MVRMGVGERGGEREKKKKVGCGVGFDKFLSVAVYFILVGGGGDLSQYEGMWGEEDNRE